MYCVRVRTLNVCFGVYVYLRVRTVTAPQRQCAIVIYVLNALYGFAMKTEIIHVCKAGVIKFCWPMTQAEEIERE